MNKQFFTFYFLLFTFYSAVADAFQYSSGRFGFRANGYGTVGGISSSGDHEIHNFRFRGQVNYATMPGWTIGAVYSIDQLAIDQDMIFSDAFIFTESPHGRAEIGFTNSVAGKMAVGLPDVGHTRINNASLLYNHINHSGGIISNPSISDTRYDFRVSVVSVPTNPIQVGVSFAPSGDNFNTATDIALRLRQPHGRTMYSVFAGASVIDRPRDLNTDIFMPNVTADRRMQFATGAHVQQGSYNFGATLRVIYDQGMTGVPTDGIQIGGGLSYDFLQHSVSGTYILSAVGVWNNHEIMAMPHNSYITHTVLLSYRNRISPNIEMSLSAGAVITDEDNNPFVTANMHLRF